MNKKIGRNDKCHCNSGKKYKKCCLNKEQLDKMKLFNLFQKGHDASSENIGTIKQSLEEEYKEYANMDEHQIIDVTNILTQETYKPLQIANYKENTIMIVERNDANDAIFSERGTPATNIMVMYRGAYQCLDYQNFDSARNKIRDMVATRYNGDEYKG
jgi:hypothetical protein